jgi:protocatechuate 3,4-dioxygenase alpha subunit
MAEKTPSQTVGPYFGIALPGYIGQELVLPDTAGAVRIRGRVVDGAGDVVPDAMVEIWQAGEPRGFGRCGTDGNGAFEFVTVKPGGFAGQAPHMDVSVFARGLLKRLVTRIYFDDEESANAVDPVLSAVPAAERGTLVARAEDGGYCFDIHLQGDEQTTFFEL